MEYSTGKTHSNTSRIPAKPGYQMRRKPTPQLTTKRRTARNHYLIWLRSSMQQCLDLSKHWMPIVMTCRAYWMRHSTVHYGKGKFCASPRRCKTFTREYFKREHS